MHGQDGTCLLRGFLGVYVHFDRNGNILFGGDRWHRLIVAQMAGLRTMPAQAGVVHEQAVRLWKKKVIDTSLDQIAEITRALR